MGIITCKDRHGVALPKEDHVIEGCKLERRNIAFATVDIAVKNQLIIFLCIPYG